MSSGRAVSHGRGGAGNIHTNGKATTAADLVTPTIKQDFFTTGRGGTGNMMYNDKDRPELARGSQDVEKPPKRSEESVQFTGRGGVANAVIPTVEEQKAKHTAADPQPERLPSQERPKEVPGGKTN
ncbi:hypothetical protein TCE0_047r18013 [Talaromyces pinophilus]|uniref:Uncharacterized protein n=1 Tax=Talaromyces pinophilus TaxID=128442 RepID=A0A0B8N286_TALPI|nr:hypothetical protein PENOC_065840 [Penicillium occitanis (nom. inval.)]PCH01965.1 Protein of unknown function DUF3602 [Penicillium occitanis (nom. inval.)]GAM43306.1 hypothetical protein TCE0_047r18013 [Talaromyces pinophilus]